MGESFGAFRSAAGAVLMLRQFADAMERDEESRARTPPDPGPREPNNDMVICPNCTCQFVAIPINVQKRLQDIESELGIKR